MLTRPYLLHALSPLHAGTGQAVDVIDLPIARLRSTGIPLVPGSSVKGVLREARSCCCEKKPCVCSHQPLPEAVLHAVFGPETEQAADHAGALVVGDARLLALPVRSFSGTFAWVSSPLLLSLAQRDGLKPPELPKAVPSFTRRRAFVSSKQGAQRSLCLPPGKDFLFLEDLDLPADQHAWVEAWARRLGPLAGEQGEERFFQQRFAIVDDETMTFLWETATQLDTRVRLDAKTRTVAKGALWTEESLPPETLLLGLLAADRSRKEGQPLSPQQVLQHALGQEEVLQFGGKASVGRGRCRIVPVLG